MPGPRLSIRALRKSFNVPVLKGVDLDIDPGEIHAIVGENGAGKSTLVNVLAGLLPMDGGELFLDGEAYEPANARNAVEAGVSFAAQELSIVDSLSVAENIALRALPRRGLAIDRRSLNDKARKLLARVGMEEIEPETTADHLSLANRQRLELAKAIYTDCRLLILDEPTASLNASQAERVHRIIGEMAAAGVAVVYISHRLSDVLAIADTVTVLRDGEVISSVPATDTSVERMMAEMTGGEIAAAVHRHDSDDEGPLMLEARAVTTTDLPHEVDLACRGGEIIGFAGLAGAGKTELLQALFGLVPLKSGSIVRHLPDKQAVIRSPGEAVRSGVGFLAENRQAMGIFPGLSVLDNVMTPGGAASSSPLSMIDRKAESAAGDKLKGQLTIRCGGLDQPIEQLSGGNQQKALIARWLRRDARVLLLDEPTRGVDVGTKEAIYRLLLALRDDGRSIVVSSSENEELMTICDRIVVMSNRKPVAEFHRGNWSENAILSAAFRAFAERTNEQAGVTP